MIEVEGLFVSYGGCEALRGLALDVGEGEFFGLLGPNGAGKTTAISALCGLIEPTRGVIRIAGIDCRTDRKSVRGLIGLVPQHLAFYPALSARQNLEFFGRLQGCLGGDLDKSVKRALDFARLADRADRPASTLSGGMKRRLNVAIGLLHQPRLLILDEPTVGVDAQSRSSMLRDFEEIGRGGTTVLYTTHLMDEAERLCDRVAILDEGRIVAAGTPADLIERDGKAILRVRFGSPPPEGFSALLGATPEVKSVVRRSPWLEIAGGDGAKLHEIVTRRAAESGVDIRQVDLVEPDLDSVFLTLTGRDLRD